MLTSLAFIFLTGFSAAYLCAKLGIPRMVGMLGVGVALGPHALNLLDATILLISPDIRQLAFVIILLKAGFALQLKDMQKMGRPAFLLACIPASCEIAAFMLFAPTLFNITLLQAALMGTIVAAVSPAVVVPAMVTIMERGYGVAKKIPQMLLTGASLDGIFVVLVFSSLLSITQEGITQGGIAEGVQWQHFSRIPLSIGLGVFVGILAGYAAAAYFSFFTKYGQEFTPTLKIIALLCMSIGLLFLEKVIPNSYAFSALLAIMTMAITIRYKSASTLSAELSQNLGKFWQVAEVLLFVLVGAAVDVRVTLNLGFMAVAMLVISLLFRSCGVFVALLYTKLTYKERAFCIMAYWPKATVQAAIGSVPLAMGIAGGESMLSMAVLAIVLTVPLGVCIEKIYARLLNKN